MPSFHVSRKALTCSGSRVFLIKLAILHVAGTGRNLPIGVKFDPVGRIEINALDLAAQALAFGKAGHDLQAVAQDHAVRPVLVVLVKLGLGLRIDAIEVTKQIEHSGLFVLPLPSSGASGRQ